MKITITPHSTLPDAVAATKRTLQTLPKWPVFDIEEGLIDGRIIGETENPDFVRFCCREQGYAGAVEDLSNAEFLLLVRKPKSILNEVAEERGRQDTKWGEQNHPSFFPGKLHVISGEREAKRTCDLRTNEGTLSFADILLEEVAEVFGTNTVGEFGASEPMKDESLIREELVQVAAVAVSWIEAIDRRAEPEARKVSAQNVISCVHDWGKTRDNGRRCHRCGAYQKHGIDYQS